MKEKLIMQKVKYKKGVTLVELLICTSILSILITSIYYFCYFYQINNIKKEQAINNLIIINECYELFSSNPASFKTNLLNYYGGKWEKDEYYFEKNQELMFKAIEDEEGLKIEIYKKGVLIEVWHRKKVT